MARTIFNDSRQPAASAACDIAFNFLVQSGAMRDEFEAVVFLAQYLARMVDQGHSNKILMANHAISAYQASVQEPGCAVRKTAQTQSMEQVFRARLAHEKQHD